MVASQKLMCSTSVNAVGYVVFNLFWFLLCCGSCIVDSSCLGHAFRDQADVSRVNVFECHD